MCVKIETMSDIERNSTCQNRADQAVYMAKHVRYM